MKKRSVPQKVISTLASRGYLTWLPDKTYLKLLYWSMIGKMLDLNTPQTFNEKLQWLKLYDRRPEYIIMVDKYKVREYIAEKIGEEHLIPLLGVWDDPDEIDFEQLPDQFVMKCNHNSGRGMCICKDKSKLDISKVKAELRKGLDEDYYLTGREWPYKDVPRKIIAERYMSDNANTDELSDYKFMCFNGRVECSFTCTDRFSGDGLKVTFFDRNWEQMPFARSYPVSKKKILKPQNYDKMLEMAECLSEGIPFLRVDFYEINGEVFFGELTLYPGSGFEAFQPEEWDYKFGEWIELPEKKLGE